MAKLYERINWEDLPSKNTPINAENLNKMDKAIDDLDNKIEEGRSGYLEKNNPTGTGAFSMNRREATEEYPIGDYSTAEGDSCTASGYSSHAEGYYTTSIHHSSHAEGHTTVASGLASHAEGTDTIASGFNSHAEGECTTASGNVSHAEGAGAKASGLTSHAEGANTIASGSYSHAEGKCTTASGSHSHAEGFGAKTIFNNGNVVYEYKTNAKGLGSHAEGAFTVAGGRASHAEGEETIASGDYQHVQGKYNVEDTNNEFAHIVGGGTSDTDRKNIHTLDWEGNAVFAGDVANGNGVTMDGLKTLIEELSGQIQTLTTQLKALQTTS